MEKKTQSEMEQIALLELRKSKDKKLLSNTSVDCFVMGYMRAQEDIFVNFGNSPIPIANFALKHIGDIIKAISETAAYSGRPFSQEEALRVEVANELRAAIESVMRGENFNRLKNSSII